MFTLILLLFLNSFLLTDRFEPESISEFIVVFIIFFYSQLIGISVISGIFHILTKETFFYLLLIILCVILMKGKKIKRYRLPSFPPLISLFLSIAITIHLLYLFNIIVLPPLTTDGILYHLPFAIHYLKTNSISIPSLYFTDIAMSYYPQTGEFLYLFSLFSGKEFLFKFTQFPFLILGGFCVFLIMKDYGFSNFLSVIGALIFSLIKPVLSQSHLEFVDLIMASSFLSSLYFLGKREKKYLIVGILSLAILISTKTLSFIFAFLTLPFLFNKKNGKFYKIPFSISIVFLLFFGLFSYTRNFLLTKNPFFPAKISIGNLVLFDGIYEYEKLNFTEKIKAFFPILISPFSHIDPSFSSSIFLYSFFIISFFISIFLRDRKSLFIFSIVPFSIIGYILFLSPCYYQLRHFLPLYGIFVFSLLYPYKIFKKLEYLCIPVFISFCISVFPYFLLFSFFIISFFIFLFFFLSYKFKKSSLYFVLLLIIWFFFFFQVKNVEKIYNSVKISFWKSFYKEEADLWEFIQKNSKEGKNIIYIGDFFLYPFYGDKFQNNVFYQSVNSVETLPVYKYKGVVKFPKESPEIIYRKNPSFNLWFEGIKIKKVDWIVIKKTSDYIERKWIEENQKFFKKIFSNGVAEIYYFVK